MDLSPPQEIHIISKKNSRKFFIYHIKSNKDLLLVSRPVPTTSFLQPRISAIVGVIFTISPIWLPSLPTERLLSIPDQ